MESGMEKEQLFLIMEKFLKLNMWMMLKMVECEKLKVMGMSLLEGI